MHSRHATTAGQALYRVFVLPTLSKQQPQRILTATVPRISTPQPQHTRAFSHTPQYNSKTRAPEQRTQKWNNEIRARQIYLVDPSTNQLYADPTTGSTLPPRTKWDILNNLDEKTHRLVQLSPDEDENPHFIPVCKIVSKKESYEQDKKRKIAQKEQKKAQMKAGEDAGKTMELNWAIDRNDLGHRLEKVRGFLEEGRRVEVVLAGKKRGRKASLEECQELLKRIREVVEGVEGAREKEAMQGKIGGFATLVLQGKPFKGQGVKSGGGGEEGEGEVD